MNSTNSEALGRRRVVVVFEGPEGADEAAGEAFLEELATLLEYSEPPNATVDWEIQTTTGDQAKAAVVAAILALGKRRPQ